MRKVFSISVLAVIDIDDDVGLGPSLDELSFPVHRVIKKTPSRSGGNLFFLFVIFFIDYNVQIFFGKRTTFSKNMEKKVPVGPFKPTRAVDRKQLFT